MKCKKILYIEVFDFNKFSFELFQTNNRSILTYTLKFNTLVYKISILHMEYLLIVTFPLPRAGTFTIIVIEYEQWIIIL